MARVTSETNARGLIFVRRGTFVVIHQRCHSLVYFDKKTSIWFPLLESVAIFLLPAVALALLVIAIIDPSATLAQEPNRSAPDSTTENGLKVLRERTAQAVLENLTGAAVLTEMTTLPSVWPLRGKLTDGFGNRRNPFNRRLSEFHPGQDISAPQGTPVSVTADGIVVFAGEKKGYGRVVIVDHGNNISTRYGHLSLVETTLGTLIKRGEQIGLVGSTGRSTGPHLHYEVRVEDVPVNPLAYLPKVLPEVPQAINKSVSAKGDKHHDLETDQGSRRRGGHRR